MAKVTRAAASKKVASELEKEIADAFTIKKARKEWKANKEIWEVIRVPRDFWNDKENQKKFFEWFGKKNNFKTLDDWYQITGKEIRENGGRQLLSYFGESYVKAIQSVYNEHDWKVWKFKQTPLSWWDDEKNCREFLEYCEKKLDIKTKEDWYRVSHDQICNLGGTTLIQKVGGIKNLLQKYFPQYNFDWSFFDSQANLGLNKSQQLLLKTICEIFPQVPNIHSNYKSSDLIYSDSKMPMELDIYIPSLSLAFEYQGAQHYEFYMVYGNPSETRKRDEEKRQACLKAGITLIEVPYWWDMTHASLLHTIYLVRPDLIKKPPQDSQPIPKYVAPKSLPKNSRNQFHSLRYLLPEIWKQEIDITGWWISEKTRGVRAIWSGDSKSFYLRSGEVKKAPYFIAQNFPKHSLDGELYLSEGNRLDILNSMQNEEGWKKLKYRVFDSPGDKQPFEDRMARLKEEIKSERIDLVPFTKCSGTPHLLSLLEKQKVIMIRRPYSFYQHARSPTLLEAKNWEEMKGKVLSVQENKIEMIFPNNSIISIPVVGEFVLKPGSIISLKSKGIEKNSKLPIEPSFYEYRPDLTWENILEKEYPYYLGYGKDKGAFPRCFACKKVFTERKKLRIMVDAPFSPTPTKQPHTSTFTFCLNGHCVIDGLNRNTGKVAFPDFNNTILIPQVMGDLNRKELEMISDKLKFVE